MPVEVILMDLDDTVYQPASGLWTLIGERIGLYMEKVVGIDPPIVNALRKELFNKYGTTMRGLKLLYGIDEKDYLHFVHDVPVEQMISPNPGLKQTLDLVSLPKYIFTNADSNHANRVLNALGIKDCFQGIIDIIKMTPHCKPQTEAFELAVRESGAYSITSCLFIDDSVNNTLIAKNLGFSTIYVGPKNEPEKYDRSINSIDDLWRVLPSFLN